MEYLADHLRFLRVSRNWSQKQMAALMGIKQPTYSKIEKGNQQITLIQLGKICHDFNLELVRFLEASKLPPERM